MWISLSHLFFSLSCCLYLFDDSVIVPLLERLSYCRVASPLYLGSALASLCKTNLAVTPLVLAAQHGKSWAHTFWACICERRCGSRRARVIELVCMQALPLSLVSHMGRRIYGLASFSYRTSWALSRVRPWWTRSPPLRSAPCDAFGLHSSSIFLGQPSV